MATVTLLDVQPISSSDYRLQIDLDGTTQEFFARNVRYEGDMPAIGDFEPVRSFQELPLDVPQFHELMRVVVAVHSGRAPTFPIVLGQSRPA